MKKSCNKRLAKGFDDRAAGYRLARWEHSVTGRFVLDVDQVEYRRFVDYAAPGTPEAFVKPVAIIEVTRFDYALNDKALNSFADRVSTRAHGNHIETVASALDVPAYLVAYLQREEDERPTHYCVKRFGSDKWSSIVTPEKYFAWLNER